MIRSLAGVVLLTAGVIGTRTSGAEATHDDQPAAQSEKCHGGHGHDDDDDDHGHDSSDHGNSGHGNSGHRNTGKNRGRDDRGRGGHGPANGGAGLQQVIKVSIPSTTFLRVDKKGRVTAAATNTGCEPNKNDEVFLFQPNGKIEASFGKIPDCDWSGDFSEPGRFQPQNCNGNHHGHSGDD
jgi:hypothetical protein